MKKLRVIALLVMICMLAGSCAALAAGTPTRHGIAELGLSLVLPGDYVFFTRSTPANDPNLARYGLDHGMLMDTLNSNYMYGNGWPEDVECEITVTMMNNPALENLDGAGSAVLSQMQDAVVAQFNGMGWLVSETHIREYDNTTFVEIQYTQENAGATDSLIQLSTVHDYRTINFTMRSFGDPLTEDEKDTLRTAAASADFNAGSTPTLDMSVPPLDFSIPAYNPPSPAGSAQRMNDPLTGASFAMPEGWTLDEETYSADETNIVFATDDYSYMIVYTGIDMYAAMEAEMGDILKVAGMSRADINNDFFTLEDTAEVFSTDPGNVSMCTFGDAEFFMADLDAASSGQGMHVFYTLNYNNGYMHLVMYMGDDGARTNEFATMMNTFRLG